MEVVGGNTLLPGDPRLIDHIVCELKSQGIFDQFRKECIADVDTKPAYQNLRQRVEGSVTGFLKTQTWRPDMNKNHLREMLRKNIYASGFLETGVERIVDQVVNPKINTVFLPQVEEVVYKFLGLQKPSRNTSSYKPSNGPLTINTVDLLPTDLDPISPDTELLDKSLNKSDTINNEPQNLNVDDSKTEEFESPPFEPITEQTVFEPNDDTSNDSHISGISGLTSHDSNMSETAAEKYNIAILDLNTQDSQLSKVSSNSRLSIITTDSKHTPEKMDISDDTQSCSNHIISEIVAAVVETLPETNPIIKDEEEVIDELEEIRMEINGHNKMIEDSLIIKEEIKMEVDVEATIKQEVETTIKQEVETTVKQEVETTIKQEVETTIKQEVETTIKQEPDETVKPESKKSERHRHDSEKRRSDKHSDRKDDKDRKSDNSRKDKYKSSSKDKYNKDKTKSSKDNKSTTKDDKDKKEDKDKKDSKSKSGSSSNSKHSSRDHHKTSSKKESSHSSKSSKDTKHSKDSKSESKDPKKDDKKSSSRSRDHSRSESSKHNSSHSSKDGKSRSSSKDYRDKKDSKKPNKKDDHSSSRDKKTEPRRSADRDSNDGSSGVNTTTTSSNNNNTTVGAKEKSSNNNSSSSNKSNNSDCSNSGDSGQSDNTTQVKQQETTTINNASRVQTVEVLTDEVLINPQQTNLLQIMKLKKPKIASNIFEVRKLMKIRKRMEKLEKKRQLALENKELEDTDSLDSGTLSIDEVRQPDVEETENVSSAIVSKESWDAVEAKLNQCAYENVDFNSYVEDNSSSSNKLDETTNETRKSVNSASEDEDCLYFNTQVSPTTERFLQSVETFTKNNTDLTATILPVKTIKKSNVSNKKNKIVKAKKRKLDGIDTENNNKNIEPDNTFNAVVELVDVFNQMSSPSPSVSNGSIDIPIKTNKSRAKKPKKNTPNNSTSSLLSNNAENSDVEIKMKETSAKASRASIMKSQRYSSDDLYKPRPVVSGSSRRQRGLLNSTDKKN